MAIPNITQRQNFNSFKFLRKVVLQVHNRRVIKEFKDIKDDKGLNTPRGKLKLACLIMPTDNATEILIKQNLFYVVLGNGQSDIPVSLPYYYEMKEDQKIPQLAIVFRDSDKSQRRGNYTTYLPWYDGTNSPNIPAYNKGQKVCTLHLKDKTFCTINAVTENEGERWLNHMKQYVKTNKLKDSYISCTNRKGGRIKLAYMVPIYADYYPEGVNLGYKRLDIT